MTKKAMKAFRLVRTKPVPVNFKGSSATIVILKACGLLANEYQQHIDSDGNILLTPVVSDAFIDGAKTQAGGE